MAGGEVSVVTRNGKITYYSHDGRFEAICRVHQEELCKSRCRLTRTSVASDRRRDQGRPLGLMMAWLEDNQARPDGRNSHVMPLFVKTAYSFQRRKAYRAFLRTLSNGPALLACERAQRDDESSEPEGPP